MSFSRCRIGPRSHVMWVAVLLIACGSHFIVNIGTTNAEETTTTETTTTEDGTTTAAPEDAAATTTAEDGTTTAAPEDAAATTTAEDGTTTAAPEDAAATTTAEDGTTTAAPEDAAATTTAEDKTTTATATNDAAADAATTTAAADDAATTTDAATATDAATTTDAVTTSDAATTADADTTTAKDSTVTRKVATTTTSEDDTAAANGAATNEEEAIDTVTFQLGMKMTENYVYNLHLRDKTSEDYVALVNEILLKLENVFRNSSENFVGVVITGFVEGPGGSVITQGQVTFKNDSTSAANVTQTIEDNDEELGIVQGSVAASVVGLPEDQDDLTDGEVAPIVFRFEEDIHYNFHDYLVQITIPTFLCLLFLILLLLCCTAHSDSCLWRICQTQEEKEKKNVP